MGLPARLPLLLAVVALLAPRQRLAAEEGAPRAPASRLTAEMRALWEGDGGALGENDVRLRLKVENPGPKAVRVLSGQLLARADGGWLTPVDPPALSGTFLKDTTLEPGASQAVTPPLYKLCGSLLDVVAYLDTDDGPAVFCAPLSAGGTAAGTPACALPPLPVGLGVQGPLEAVPYADGRRSIVVVGQVQVLGTGTLGDVRGSVLVAAKDGAGTPVEWRGGVGDGVGPGLWPFLQRLDVAGDFAGGTVSVRVRALHDGKAVTAALDVPARAVEPFPCRSPVLGAWQLGNGPGEKVLHANLLQWKSRYAWDLVILQDGSTHGGDVGSNDSYYAWNRPVRAVADGEVVEVVQDQPDRSGAPASTSPCLFRPANRVVLRHEGGVHTAYLHLQQGKVPSGVKVGARVRTGDLIGLVGNSGFSSEPHLHLLAFERTQGGTLHPIPLAFTNAYEDAEGRRPLVGVPVGGSSVHFLAAPPK